MEKIIVYHLLQNGFKFYYDKCPDCNRNYFCLLKPPMNHETGKATCSDELYYLWLGIKSKITGCAICKDKNKTSKL